MIYTRLHVMICRGGHDLCTYPNPLIFTIEAGHDLSDFCTGHLHGNKSAGFLAERLLRVSAVKNAAHGLTASSLLITPPCPLALRSWPNNSTHTGSWRNRAKTAQIPLEFQMPRCPQRCTLSDRRSKATAPSSESGGCCERTSTSTRFPTRRGVV